MASRFTKYKGSRKDGDWDCLCGTMNFASKSSCFRCQRSKPVERKAGDWDCLCGTMNFASKSQCFRCNKPKPGMEGKEGEPVAAAAPVPQPSDAVGYSVNNDWKCTVCGFKNFRRNDKCKSCQTDKSFKDIVESKLKEVDDMKRSVEEAERRAKEVAEIHLREASRQKAELEKELDAVRRLGTADSQMCVVCTENPKNALCLPCNHVFACMACVKHLKICSICRASIDSVQQVFVC